VKQLALGLPSSAWKDVAWRPGSQETLRSGFAAVRVRPAHRDEKRTEPHPEEWLLIEWPRKESEPTKYWLSTLPVQTSLKSLVKMAKHRWIMERDYEELKQELGLGHYEGRSWRGFHHPHSVATLHIELARQLLQQLPHCPFCGSPSG
jgi:SRSO17 transposase